MEKETGLPFRFCKKADDLNAFPHLSKESCILLTAYDQEATQINRGVLLNTLCHYAKLLEVPEFGDIVFTDTVSKQEKLTKYKVDKTE